MPVLMSLAASYAALADAVGRYVETLRDRVEDCHRARDKAEEVLDEEPARGTPKWRRATRWSDSVLGQILGWNPSSQGGNPNSWGGPKRSRRGGDD